MSRRKKGDPCDLCIERDWCREAQLPPCPRKERYDEYRKTLPGIRRGTMELMEAHRNEAVNKNTSM